MAAIKIFVDTDIVVAGLLSETGAAAEVLRREELERYISVTGEQELTEVGQRLGIEGPKLDRAKQRLQIRELKKVKGRVVEEYGRYAADEADTHIVAGAVGCGCRFLVTYNIKHYRVAAIRSEFKILVVRPGELLQYLRSRS